MMASASSQPQFRNTQPPSKVIHLRNLPWECTEEELIELGKPFGKIVNTKCNVGANRNQAFIEFADLNQAIAMISYYASSAEPAQLRGKTVYLQYSNRQEIVNNKTTGDVPSNVLLVTIEGVEAGDVSIDVLHVVFSAFGFVNKIATFEKTAGFQALVQFSDSETASTAKNALDGRSIPRYLLQEHVGPCTLRITFSAHTDLNVKFQSHRSRDYTNPFLPVAPSAMDVSGQLGFGQDGMKQEPESNVILATVENMQYAITIDVLYMVFSAFGTVQKIAIFEKNAGFQALIQYPDIRTARTAKESLEGHCIYGGGFCKLHLTYSHHTNLNVKINNDRGRDYTGGNTATMSNQPSILGPQPIPGLGGTAPYNSVPYPPPNAMIEPQPGASWDTGAGTVSPLPAQLQNQMYMHQGAMPPGVGPQMMPLPGQGSQLGPPPPGMSPQVVPLPGQGSQQGTMPGMGPQTRMMQLPGQGSQQRAMPPGMSTQMMQFPDQGGQQFPMPFSLPYGR
ncbi:polypyrimidine tract-binding protein homolog 1 [Elaeis guineensis]|uniref:Polypyrimidine tract-binding protein homolog 1 isoform X1 n=1 Tax=Elaeis guineensis var. tenera TaxID=51953 RepID=A0A6I9REU3_ELAGV|nr:polypyrimidine tract-binding protein homolog 1 isoform X1 [Elaeis guineensis]XP_010924848.1 polypyrimidine tract-binding protein homolog 1 isoform X1 [Elaeis guineensis]XP_010924849.1 polypyrimidine tract-binding protein homolog 1 isoform X1 [Elaeis guineensis]